MNIIAQQEFELAYYDSTVQPLHHGSPPAVTELKAVLLSGVNHHVWCQDWLGSTQQAGKGELCIWKTVRAKLFYIAKLWVTNCHHLQRWLNQQFNQRCFRIILNFVTNIEVLKLILRIEAMLLKSKLCWPGYAFRMKIHRQPKSTLYVELSTGHQETKDAI